MPCFPPRFQPEELIGPRGCQFPERYDAFQQLVGDGLKEQFVLAAQVCQTKGNDGSIDIWVDGPAFSFQAPVIIECKDSDDSLSSVWDNVEGGWYKVRTKLKKHAAEGWSGLFAPWKQARTYAYCTSADLPKEQRDHLKKLIEKFFNELPADQKPGITGVEVLTWSDIRAWLDTMARVADLWMGAGLPVIMSQQEYLDSLTGFREYLLPEKLPFLTPDPGSPAAPENILRLLEKAGPDQKPGALLVGPGGVGKTRTCLEAATLAAADGWRVLHVLADEPGPSNEDIARALIGGGGKTLLVFDYLDQMHSLDLPALGRRVLPEARRRGHALALLASARPGWAAAPDVGRDTLFEKVPLRPTDRQSGKIAVHMVTLVAPLAIEKMGIDKVLDFCGQRPIIALFIARELERLAVKGDLAGLQNAPPRPGMLTDWLLKRLREDHLAPEPSPGLLPPAAHAEPSLAAAAAILAACPQEQPNLVAAAEASLRKLAPERAAFSGMLLAKLMDMGWVEQRGPDLASAHDAVADEVFRNAIKAPGVEALWPRALDPVLAGALPSPRSLGRYAISVERLLGLEDARPAGLGKSIRACAQAWLKQNSGPIGASFTDSEPGGVSYALGALFACSAWTDEVLALWPALVAPWLSRYRTDPSLRHFLYRGLRFLPAEADIVSPSLCWLESNRANAQAGFVIAPLLGRADLGGHTEEAKALALEWLNTFNSDSEARFVLSTLLARNDLGEQAEKAVSLAIEWLNTFKKDTEARFVLQPLLARNDLGEHEGKTLSLAIEWLNKFNADTEASFVLPSLLTRNDLGEQTNKAVSIALEWLDKFKTDSEAPFVLSPLLSRNDLGEQAEKAISLAFEWLNKFIAERDAQFVFNSLLARNDLGGHEGKALSLAFEWLNTFKTDIEAGFVFNSLLARNDLGEQAGKAISLAIEWLNKFNDDSDSGYVYRTLLARNDLGEQAQKALSLALEWLDKFKTDIDAQFVFNSLLTRNDLGGQAEKIVELALAWLSSFSREIDAGFVLPPLLSRPGLTAGREIKSIKFALPWLDLFFETQDAEFVLKALGKSQRLTFAQIEHFSRLAMKRLALVRDTEEATFLLKALLKVKSLPKDVSEELVSQTIDWLRKNAGSENFDYVCNRVLRDPFLPDELWKEAAGMAVGWLKRTPHNDKRDFTYNSVLMRVGLLDADWEDYLLADLEEWMKSCSLSGAHAERLEKGLTLLKRRVRNRA